MNCPKALELIKESQELHTQALAQIQKFCDTFSDLRPKNDLNIFTELRKINTRYENLKKQINENLEQIKIEVFNIVKIDTTIQPHQPSLNLRIYDHDTSLGAIEWNKEKYKDALYTALEQNTGTIQGEGLYKKIKEEGIEVLNASVLDYLIANPDQIPDEWKGGNEKEDQKYIFFWGTIFSDRDNIKYVRFLRFSGNTWEAGEISFHTDILPVDYLAILVK